MLDVTDAAFRRIIATYGKFTRPDGTTSGGPDVMWTEFVSADGLCSVGREKLLPMLAFSQEERPIVAQIFGADPAHIREAAALIAELGFDGIDINMGCPDRKVVKQNAGAALIRTPKLAQDIIRAAQEGGGGLPVSVKTRTGDMEDTLAEWLPHLLEMEPAAVTIHARTRKDMSKVPARWERVAQAVGIRDTLGSSALIIGNGDVPNIAEGERRAKESGCDGVMIGRGVFGNPWVFRRDGYVPTREETLRVLLEHTKLFEELYGADPLTGRRVKSFDLMKKHFAAYVHGWEGAKELRVALMAAKNVGEVEEVVRASSTVGSRGE
jgi:nifR3 family TIM-barrel protein